MRRNLKRQPARKRRRGGKKKRRISGTECMTVFGGGSSVELGARQAETSQERETEAQHEKET